MWYLWTALLLAWCAQASAGGAAAGTPAPPAPPPRRTLDRKAAELAWRSWLQSPESGYQNAPPRRITTKSLFITPLVCPKGQRVDVNGCVQVVTVNKEEHERILLEQLNALFTPVPNTEYFDYGDQDLGPLQLSIPINLDPQAAPLQAQEPNAEATQDSQLNYVKVDKTEENKLNIDANLDAQLEMLKQQNAQIKNVTDSSEAAAAMNNNLLNNLVPSLDKPKRDSPADNATDTSINDRPDQGQKEQVYGHVNVDPILFNLESQTANTETETEATTEIVTTVAPVNNHHTDTSANKTSSNSLNNTHDDTDKKTIHTTMHVLETGVDKTKLNPENDYTNIGEAIKLISRYAEVTTDDNFSKEKKYSSVRDDNILGTRTRQQHRRLKPRPDMIKKMSSAVISPEDFYRIPNEAYYRYPWRGQNSQAPPANYPFRHLQDYWPGQKRVGGVYAAHENPRRHHHAYPHEYFRAHGPRAAHAPNGEYPGPPPQLYHRPLQHYDSRPHANNQDLYTLLGLRHWFSSEGTSKR